MPTEAEWEYSCRGGPVQYKQFHFGDQLTSTLANFGNKLGRPSVVGSYKKPNNFGLHNMHGNVFERCSDWYDKDYYANSPETDPPGGAGSNRVIRGGSWDNSGRDCRSAYRYRYSPANRGYSRVGFRVALVPSR